MQNQFIVLSKTQKRLPPISSWPVWNGETPNERRIAGGIELHQAVCGLDQTPSRAYPAAKRGILGQQFLCALKRELGPVDALPGIRHRASVGFHGVHHDSLTHGGPDRSRLPELDIGGKLATGLAMGIGIAVGMALAG
ncbi:hypothetical protein [Mesorhizobium prunaredense]|uniref:hypothetical protein n=1 Tax=Mesorhizobium prunaredense TaxID=1631249 RepID=UPI00142E2344|nr:hypothetical protein [Mesorhizobium prunaredense]